ncbi:MAG: TSUP family transporter [Candidatus Tectimicrobiota bacterium]
MLDTFWLWLLTAVSGLAASTVTTITGVGAGLIVYGTLGCCFDLKLLIALSAPAQLLSGALRLWVFRGAIRWSLGWRFFLGVLPGIYGGTLIFQVLSELLLRRLLGVFLLGFAVYEYYRRPVPRPVPHWRWLPVSGCLAGVLLGSVGVPGPFLAVVFLRYGLLKEDLVAMIALFFLVGNVQRTLLYWHQETLTRQHLKPRHSILYARASLS